jgi:endonuclease/exonuclease/phosphatase family metal-dependent hydrolase
MRSSDRRPAIRVATMNLLGRQGDWQARRAVLSRGFAALAADLVALQEVAGPEMPDQAAELFAGEDVHVVRSSQRDAKGESIAIVSRWPVAEVHEIPHRPAEQDAHFLSTTCAIVAEVPPPIGPVLFVNHFPDWQLTHQREREEQAVSVAACIENLVAGRPMHVIVAGDLDATPDSSSIRFWTGLQSLSGISVCYVDAWHFSNPQSAGHTFTPANPLLERADGGIWALETGRRIDYILLRAGQSGPALRPLRCELIFDGAAGGPWASDHMGVAADLTPEGGSTRDN